MLLDGFISHYEVQLSVSETPHYPFLPRSMIFCISRLNGFMWSLYLEFLICSIQSPSNWEQLKYILLKKMFCGLFRCLKYWAISVFFQVVIHNLGSLRAPLPTHNFLSHFSSSCAPPSLQYFDCCIYQGVPNQVSFLKRLHY